MTEWHAKWFHPGLPCLPARCACRCGCTVDLGCTHLLDMCSECHMSMVRDDDEVHGPILAPGGMTAAWNEGT